MQMTFEHSPEHPGALFGRLGGSFDIAAAAEFWKTASELVDTENRFVVLDLTDLAIMTSAGLGILVRLYARLKDYGGGLAIFGCSDKVHETFAIVMIDNVLKVSDSEADAWAALET